MQKIDSIEWLENIIKNNKEKTFLINDSVDLLPESA